MLLVLRKFFGYT